MDKYNEYETYFKTYQTRQEVEKNIGDEWIRKVIEMYDYSKSIITEQNYDFVNKRIMQCTNKTPFKYILDIKCKPKLDRSYKTLDCFLSKEEVLDFIVSETRNSLCDKYPGRLIIPHEELFDSFDTTGRCYEACKEVIRICNRLGIKNKRIEISPGFNDSLELMQGYGHHYIVFVELEKEWFLIDCAYKQFFDVTYCLLEAMGICNGELPWLGIYMVMNQDRKKISEKLLSDGWLKIDEKTMKDYFDGFALRYRNALYYENLGYLDFSTNYTANDYEAFIFGDDRQTYHDQIEHLGIQKKFIKNPKIEFKTDLSLIK